MTTVRPKRLSPRDEPEQGALTFETVYEEHFDFVWRMVANRGVSDALVDDVVQEVFVVVHRRLADYEGRASVRAWVAGIVRRVVIDQLRVKRHQPAGEMMPTDPVDPNTPADVLETKQAIALLDALLATMSEEQREVFLLHEIEGLTGKEIGAALDLNPNTVWTRLRAARGIFAAGVARRRAAETWSRRDG